MLGSCFIRVIVGELNKQRMQCEGTFEDFFDLLTKTYEQHKKKPKILETELGKVIERGKEMLQELQRQDRFV